MILRCSSAANLSSPSGRGRSPFEPASTRWRTCGRADQETCEARSRRGSQAAALRVSLRRPAAARPARSPRAKPCGSAARRVESAPYRVRSTASRQSLASSELKLLRRRRTDHPRAVRQPASIDSNHAAEPQNTQAPRASRMVERRAALRRTGVRRATYRRGAGRSAGALGNAALAVDLASASQVALTTPVSSFVRTAPGGWLARARRRPRELA